jgi:death on curing protein
MELPSFLLSVDDVIEIHEDQIANYGGSAGVRDMGLLDSAVAAPKATYGGQLLHDDLAAMAGAYLYSLAKNHPFVDGNKRVATAAALVFLRANGYTVACLAEELTDAVLAVAKGEWNREAISQFFRDHLAPWVEET